MKTKEAKYKKVRVTQRIEVSPAVYGCDECRKEIKDYPNENSRLEVTAHSHDVGSENLHFCSWKCVLKHIPKIKCEYFVSLPFLYFDERNGKDRSASELIAILTAKAKLKPRKV